MHPMYMVDDDLRAGRLATVLPDFEPTGLETHAVYPERRIQARVRHFIEFLRERLPRESTWLGGSAPAEAASARTSASA